MREPDPHLGASPRRRLALQAHRSVDPGRVGHAADHVHATLDADTASDRTLLGRAMTQELGDMRDAVLDAVLRRLELSQKQAAGRTRWRNTTRGIRVLFGATRVLFGGTRKR